MIRLTKKNEPLSKEELLPLLLEVKKGSLSARNEIIEHCLKFVVHIANRYSNTEIDSDDLFSIGVIGLTKGIEKYDVEKYGVQPFSTFIGKSIENEILMHFRKDKNKIRPISLEDCVNERHVSNGKDELRVEEILPCKEIESIEAIIRGEELKALHNAIKKLSEREQYIIKSYFGIGKLEELNQNHFYADTFGTNNPTIVQRLIAEKIHTSRSYVSRQISDIIEKLYYELTFNQTKGISKINKLEK